MIWRIRAFMDPVDFMLSVKSLDWVNPSDKAP